MSGWRYIATKLNGDGTESMVDFNLPLSKVKITEELTGPGGVSATITPEVLRLTDIYGNPILDEWSTGIYAEKDGQIRHGGILVGMDLDGPSISLDVMGLSGYPNGMPYTGDYRAIDTDAFDIVREAWSHLQSKPNGNLGMKLSTNMRGIKVGTKTEQVAFTTNAGEDVAFNTDGSYRLAWYQTDDLGHEIATLAGEVPFEYLERHLWNGEVIEHHLDLSARVGRRRHDLRFVVGENVIKQPKVVYDGDEYASEVMVLGSGEGRKMIRGNSPHVAQGRLRRVAVVADKTISSKKRADARAKQEANARRGIGAVDEIVMLDHPNAPVGSVGIGDDIFLQSAREGWASGMDMWVRVVSRTTSPDDGEAMVLSVTPVQGA